MNAQIEMLQKVVGNLKSKDAEFAQSMIDQFTRKGTLSDKQWPWVESLLDRAMGSGEPQRQPEATVEGQFGVLTEMFITARKHLKFPKIRFQVEGSRIQFSLAGPKSKYAGSIMVTDGGSYGSNEWYGAIDQEGHWRQPVKGVPANIEKLVRTFVSDPARYASEWGRLAGHCIFCSRLLTDEKSTDVGFGKTCARNYNLPWGKKH